MSKMIYLVRHGEYNNPHNILPERLPVELSEVGIKQAEKLREYFRNKNISKIYSSPVLRCKQTAEIIGENTINISYDLRLAETFSAYQGMWYEDQQNWKDFFLHRRELGGESFKDIQKRMISFFNEIALKENRDIIICSHGDPLWCLYLGILNKSLTNEIEEPGEHGNPEYLKKCSIRPLKIESNIITVLPMLHQEDL